MTPFAPVCGCPEHDFGCAQLPTKVTMPDLAILTDEQIETYLSPAHWERRLTIKEGLRQLLIDHPHLEDAEIVLVPLKNFSRI